MTIKYRNQDKLSLKKSRIWIDLIDGSKHEIDFIDIEKIIKDFCFIRHELSNYSYLYASQLKFESHLNIPYWEYLFVNGKINESEKDEIEEGALLTIYLLFSEIFEDKDACYLYINDLFETIRISLDRYKPNSYKKQKILDCIKFAQEHHKNENLIGQISKKKDSESEKVLKTYIKNDKWIYSVFVEKYYIDKVNSFETGRQLYKFFLEQIENRNQF